MYIADLHIHSKYSRATSGEAVPEYLDLWARKKGIGLMGTGDFTHPAWRAELREKLIPAEEGLYVLKEERRLPGFEDRETPRFVVTGEISSIYKKNGRTRKIHNVILLPSLEAAEALSGKLEAIGNIHSDGRPILGLDSRDLLEILLETCPRGILVPAHIWTPHFSLFGAFSGFDTMEECFEDLTGYIHAVETGLSSDPAMNGRLTALDGYTLISNSDAHSPSKLGREANLIEGELSYTGLARALEGEGLVGTLEFFPEEGKYHLDGHRNCGVRLTPAETARYGGRCPVCGRKITVGVLNRVEALADRPEGAARLARPYESLIPLAEVIAASTGYTPASRRVQGWYEGLLAELGSEFYILREAPLTAVGRAAGPLVEEGVRRLRAGEVTLSPGYDGEYGKVHILTAGEREALAGQISFLGAAAPKAGKAAAPRASREEGTPSTAAQGGPAAVPGGPEGGGRTAASHTAFPTAGRLSAEGPAAAPRPRALFGLNEEQRAAATAGERTVAVIAGPGTGKTKTLVARIQHLVETGVKPGSITAVTFTNKAAGEMRSRLEAALGRKAARAMTIGTFHAICLRHLSRKGPVTLIDEFSARSLAAEAAGEAGVELSAAKLLADISRMKGGLAPEHPEAAKAYPLYQQRLAAHRVLDYDDLLLRALEDYETAVPGSFAHLLVDEFQDLSPVQYRLVLTWTARGALFAIGDPDQSIYGFRGSSADGFRRLGEDKPGLRTIRLVKNYRSSPGILAAALPALGRAGDHLQAQRPGGPKPVYVNCPGELAEGVYVAKAIAALVGGMDMLSAGTEAGLGFSDIAVLYRTHRQGEMLEYCLKTEGIPYVVSGREDFLAEETVRRVLAFFRYLLDRGDELSRALAQPLLGSDFEARAAEYGPHAGKDRPDRLIAALAAQQGLQGPALDKLVQAAALFRSLGEFLTNVLLGQEIDLGRSGQKSYASGAVRLMTLHGSKGLEFPAVFLTGVRAGLIPYDAPGRAADPQEERRLLYVGLTRAKDRLTLTCPGEPSPFLGDIPKDALTFEKALAGRPEGRQLTLF
ncbi:UvrD-helicase domain-containing protein [Gehongia tenuis]|uniref:DNA 3'-5' helicase n=1 Tax=Gehongia tenuis TaxID=2763655 RepID=A0A926D361_9FIRM|nr:UvrD-helicase domain-containing protein [Gehongia tenuis]MBC8530686.1 UvrD-helicase domain-containing protein [Gehongia tenuis]